MYINEQNQQWSKIITEELGIKDQNKLNWMAQYARNHEVYEAMQSQGVNTSNGLYATPLNTLGAGNPMMPIGVPGPDGFNANGQFGAGIGNTGADFHNPLYKVGSGDIPMSTLTMALQIAALTIGLELVPVIPSPGPWTMLTYNDYPYAGGKLGKINETWADGKGPDAENKPIYIKLIGLSVSLEDKKAHKDDFLRDTPVDVTSDAGKGEFKFIGFSRIDNSMILEVVSVKDSSDDDASIADLFSKKVTVKVGTYTSAATQVRPDLVAQAADHIQGFANFFKDASGKSSLDPMTRAQNETGVGNTIGARIFSKLVQMGAYEVTGTVTRQQLQDYPLYGIDVIGKVLEAMQNEISQEINNRILDRLFKLGVENYKIQRDYQGVDLNLFLGDATHTSMPLNQFTAYNKFVDIAGHTVPNVVVPSAVKNTAAENVTTHQRRIMSRVLAAANLIANVSRFGRGNWVVTNTQVLSALQDCAAFVIAPMQNTLVQDGSKSLYFAGSLAGLNVYVDPYMTWEDTRICVGRKSDGKTPGVIFMPYILADTCQIVAEGTMAPKMLVNSRFAIVDAGFQPEFNYYAFMVQAWDNAYLV